MIDVNHLPNISVNSAVTVIDYEFSLMPLQGDYFFEHNFHRIPIFVNII